MGKPKNKKQPNQIMAKHELAIHDSKKKKLKKTNRCIPANVDLECQQTLANSEDDENVSNSIDVSSSSSRETQRINRRAAKETLQRTLFVGNLPLSISKNKLIRLFNQALKKESKCASENCRVETVRFRGAVPVTGGSGKCAFKRAAIHQEFAGVSQTRMAYVVLTSPAGVQAALSLDGLWVTETNALADDSATGASQVADSDPTKNQTITNDSKNLNGRHIRVDRATVNFSKNNTDNCVFLGNLPFDVSEEEIYSALSPFGTVNHVRLIRDRTTGAVKGFGFANFNDPAAVSFAIRGSQTIQVKGRPIRIQQWENAWTSRTDSKIGVKQENKQKSVQSASSSSLPVQKEYAKKWHKLDHTGHAKGITLPSNLTGVQRTRFLTKKLQKKMKRTLRREQQRQQNSNKETHKGLVKTEKQKIKKASKK